MTAPLSTPCVAMDVPPEAMLQPSSHPPAAGVIVTLLLRLMASFLAKLSEANSSKLAALTCCPWVSDLKLGTAREARTAATARTTRSSGKVKPENDLRSVFMSWLPFVGRRLDTAIVQRQYAIAFLPRARNRGRRNGKGRRCGRGGDLDVVPVGNVRRYRHAQTGKTRVVRYIQISARIQKILLLAAFPVYHERLGRSTVALYQVILVTGKGDGSKYADNHHGNHQFDQGKAVLFAHCFLLIAAHGRAYILGFPPRTDQRGNHPDRRHAGRNERVGRGGFPSLFSFLEVDKAARLGQQEFFERQRRAG